MDILIESLFSVSEILNRARLFIVQKCFLFNNTPFSSPTAKISKMKMQRGQHIPHPVFLWTPSGTRGDTGATEKEIIKKRCCTVQTHCYSVPRHLSRCHWACHALSHTDDLTPSALWCKPLLAHTSTIILAATKSSAYASEQVKSKQHGDEHLPLLIWMAITAKLIHVTS